MPYRLSWNTLLSAKRPTFHHTTQRSNSRTSQREEERTAFEQDHDRIVFSAPFRRLARKTQVHPLATNDHIRNRLTHSMEVASVCRSFVRPLSRLASERSDFDRDAESKVTWILQAACLIHDIGNPPFGHAGEEVVRVWVEKHAPEMFDVSRFSNAEEMEQVKADWLHFEGNAQGFRLASRTDNPEAGYLRLTHATLASAIKYPWTSTDQRTSELNKQNVYTTEKEIFDEMASDLGLKMPHGICRHPLSFLTEAADDICYRIIDFEDAVEMGIQNREDVFKLFSNIAELPQSDYAWMELSQLRGRAIRTLMEKFWGVFLDDFDAIMNGERNRDLKSSLDEETQIQLDVISEQYTKIFAHSKKVAMELGAYHILGRILKALMKTVNAIHDSSSFDDLPFLSRRCAQLAWGTDFIKENFNQDHVWWHTRMRDFVSGMTDDYATSLSGEIGGHSFFNH